MPKFKEKLESFPKEIRGKFIGCLQFLFITNDLENTLVGIVFCELILFGIKNGTISIKNQA